MNQNPIWRMLRSIWEYISKIIPTWRGGTSHAGDALNEIYWRSFWRVVFDVMNSQTRLLLEVTLWDVQNNVRLGRHQEILQPTVNDGVTAIVGGVIPIDANDKAVFGPKWLSYSVNLEAIQQSLLDAVAIAVDPNTTIIQVSEPLNGENVSIRADVTLNEPEYPSVHPFFYVEQPSNYGHQPGQDSVRLFETIDPSGRKVINWWISGQQLASPVTFDFDPVSPDTQHGARVRQDWDGGNVYEFLVDSLPLVTMNATKDSHEFYEELTFLIGAMPDPNNTGQTIVLNGSIAHLEFDPNNSCGSCAG